MEQNNTEFKDNKKIIKTLKKENSNEEEETSLLLSMFDINILQNIFINLVYSYQPTIYFKEAIKKSLDLILNFKLSCKLFLNISNQHLFPLKLNQININLNYNKYLKILFIKQQVEKDELYKEKDINNIFYECCRYGYYDIINTLIKYNPNINYKQGYNEYTPLITATSYGNIKTTKKLIKIKQLNINQQSKRGKTALIYACYDRKEDTVQILLSRKDININIKDNSGKTALDYAKEDNYGKIIKIIENYQNSI